MTDRYRKALEGLRERCAQEAERITGRRRTVAAMISNEAVKPCEVAAAIRKIDVQQHYECAAREIERLEKTLGAYQTAVNKIDDLIEYSLSMPPKTKAALYAGLADLTATLAQGNRND